MTNEKTIRVMGTGAITIKPDTTVLSFHISSTHDDYAEAYETAAIGNTNLRETLTHLGLDPNSLKTTHFDIRKRFESIRVKGGWKQEFKGFTLCQNLSLDIPIDGRLTSKVLVALGKAWPDLEVTISYTKKDVEQAKLDMLQNAVKDAKRKAEAMASAIGHHLGDLVAIDYSKRSIDISWHEERMACYEESACRPLDNLDIQPEDINSEDTVETVWSIA